MEISTMTDAQVNQEARDLTSKLVNGGRKDEARDLLTEKYKAATVSTLYYTDVEALRGYLADLRDLPIVAPAAPINYEKAYIIPEGKLYISVEGLKVSAEAHTDTVDVKITSKFKDRSAALDYWEGVTERSAGAYFARLLKNL